MNCRHILDRKEGRARARSHCGAGQSLPVYPIILLSKYINLLLNGGENYAKPRIHTLDHFYNSCYLYRISINICMDRI